MRSIAVGAITALIEGGRAELTFLDLKGIDALLDYPGASPLYGYVALKSFLPNRRFLGNYGPGDRGLCGGKGQVAISLKAKNDCPLDANAELVQRLFPSPDGSNFVANQIPSDIVSRLSPLAIGKILDQLARIHDDQWAIEPAMTALKRELTDILFESVNEKRFLRSTFDALMKRVSKLAKEEDDAIKYLTREAPRFADVFPLISELVGAIGSGWFEPALNALVRRLRGAPNRLIDEVWKSIERQVTGNKSALERIYQRLTDAAQINAFIASRIEEVHSTLDQTTLNTLGMLKILKQRMHALESKPVGPGGGVQYGHRKEFADLAKAIVEAVQESRGARAVVKGVSYPKYMPEHALLAFFIQRADSKADLVSLFTGMPSLLKDKRWFNVIDRTALVDQFMRLRWSLTEDWEAPFSLNSNPDREAARAKLNVEFRERFTNWSAEKFLFHIMAMDQRSTRLPRPVSYGEATHDSARYPDCGETSLRNFFNYMLYDPATASFNRGMLNVLARADGEVSFDPAIDEFYRDFPDMTSAISAEARNEWARTVVAGHEDVEYLKTGCEIRSAGSPDNMLVLIGHLLFQDEEIRVRRWDSKSRNEKLDALCEIFSTNGRTITWEYGSPAGTNDVWISFKFNDELAFTYQFGASHFVATPGRGFDGSAWRLFFPKAGLMPGPGDTRKYLVPLMVDAHWYAKVALPFSSDRSFTVNLFYGIPMAEFSSQLQAYGSGLDLIKVGVSEVGIVTRKLRSKLPEATDLYTARQIEWHLIRTGYPLGYPAHARNRPDAVYRAVSEAELVDLFGPEVAQDLEPVFGRRLFGKSELLIADALVSPEEKGRVTKGRKSRMTVKWLFQAKEECIKLNPKGVRDAIRRESLARDNALRLLRDRMTGVHNFDCSPDGEIARIYNEYPVRGFHLLGLEEFGCIFLEMGSRDLATGDGFIPQFFPHLEFSYWTSSIGNDIPVAAENGSFNTRDAGDRQHAVRCGYDLI